MVFHFGCKIQYAKSSHRLQGGVNKSSLEQNALAKFCLNFDHKILRKNLLKILEQDFLKFWSQNLAQHFAQNFTKQILIIKSSAKFFFKFWSTNLEQNFAQNFKRKNSSKISSNFDHKIVSKILLKFWSSNLEQKFCSKFHSQVFCVLKNRETCFFFCYSMREKKCSNLLPTKCCSKSKFAQDLDFEAQNLLEKKKHRREGGGLIFCTSQNIKSDFLRGIFFGKVFTYF